MPDIVTDPYAIAKAGCCVFTGDVNPLHHDGCWYDPQHWQSDGYANAVRVTSVDSERGGYPIVFVERIVILKPEPTRLRMALACCGWTASADEPVPDAMAIESCLLYGCYDPDDGDPGAGHWSQAYIIDVIEHDPAAEGAAKANHAILADEDEIWDLINDWVGKRSCA